MSSFETQTVHISTFLSNFLWIPIRIIVALYVLIIFIAILTKNSEKKWSLNYPLHIPALLLLIFKGTLSSFIFVIAFFFDFSTKTINWFIFPEKMLLSTLLVGLLAAYEVISCLIGLVAEFRSMLKD